MNKPVPAPKETKVETEAGKEKPAGDAGVNEEKDKKMETEWYMWIYLFINIGSNHKSSYLKKVEGFRVWLLGIFSLCWEIGRVL